MANKKYSAFWLLLACILGACTNSRTSVDLPRSNPEAEGVSSQEIITFLDSASKSRHEFHSLMIVRHGKVIAEGWWNPYRSDLKHTLYSTSKSFTSTAVGFAISEKKLNLEDKVLSFFPADKPDTVSIFLAELKVKDLLTMSVGQDPVPVHEIVARDTNWVKSFLALPILYKPGSTFYYNTLASYMLSAIVQKVTGEKVIDYLKPRLFKPLGIEGIDWEVDSRNINTGGWGLRVKTEDMAKFGLLYLQKGKWQGKQVLPFGWAEEATTFKIDQAPEASQAKKDSSDWMQGYCYQFWRCRHNAFRADGAFGQYILVLPEKDAVIAITSESPDMQDELNLVWKYLYPAIKDEKLPQEVKIEEQLKNKLNSLALPLPGKGINSEMQGKISGKIYSFQPNEMKIENLSFQFKDEICTLTMKTDSAAYSIKFGPGIWQNGTTNKPGPYLINHTRSTYEGLLPLAIAASYSWTNENTLQLILRYIESPHHQIYTCHFEKNKLSIVVENSDTPGMNIPALIGDFKE